MTALAEAITFDPVDHVGSNMKARRVALGMSVKGLAERAKVDRSRLAALENGDPTVRETTIGAIERALSQLEHEMGIDPAVEDDEDDRPLADVVEFRVAGNFGVDVVVKGPVRDLNALEASVTRLIDRMQRDDESD